MIADEEEGASLPHVDLHTDEAIGVAGEVVEGDSLAEIHRAFVKRLPVAVQGRRQCFFLLRKTMQAKAATSTNTTLTGQASGNA
jgi:hypothetical protein